jgi:hypothetical protein
MRFYRVSGSRIWGDYGSMLIHGMSRHLPRLDGLIQLERAGPFIPPVTFPGIGDIVVTHGFRGILERCGLAGLTFVPVIKARIVEYHWERWDRSSESPAEIPQGGEPESYILVRPHSPEIAEELGPLWEVILPEDAQVYVVKIGRGAYEYRIDSTTWGGAPLFRPTGKRHVMEENAGEWVTFQEAMSLG